jgi:peptide/nickel transport system substrate-binding protein
MLVAGASLLAAANLASADGHGPPLKKGGVFRVGLPFGSPKIDPQKAYDIFSWPLEYATAAKLVNYPDTDGPAGSKLVPEVASKITVSSNGKRYTFTIRNGFRFSDGKRVTAKSFKYAIERTANHDLVSPGAEFITDPNGTNIVGARAALDGKTTKVSGVVASRDKLIVTLTRPDATFLAKLSMPFFQATSTKLPLNEEVRKVDGVGSIPTAGPYAFSRNDTDRMTSIRQNLFWKRGVGRNRPRNLSGVDVYWRADAETAYLQVRRNQLDMALPPAAHIPELRKAFGKNRSRYWVEPQTATGYLALNTARKVFKDVKLRRAVNYAVSRLAYVQQAGPDAGRPWSHIFGPGTPGLRPGALYPPTPNLKKAHELVPKARLRDTKINLWYATELNFPAQALIVRRDLIRLGFKAGNITMKRFTIWGLFGAMGIRGTEADLGASMGWAQDYPDPYDWINILLYGKTIGPEGNVNFSYFDVPKWNRRMGQVARLVGPRRYREYGRLEVDLMRQAAPIVPERTINNRYFFSKRVNPKSLVYQSVYQYFSFGALALK